jgi:molybdopterin/thiamine biosynthesis adenylyltransferase/molybdopterin synthase catalytic subunit/rhodanese-related sulfurtransferase
MFELTTNPIDSPALRSRLERPDAGACVVFEGWVRNHHLGRPVTQLEYEAFDDMARIEGDAIVTEIEQHHPGCTILCVHRTGALRVGELAVWIGVVSAHRAAAFLACREVIEEIKRRLPVWKKEHHPDGAAEWVNCTTEAAARGPQPADYYARQSSLPEVGAGGQEKLARARVLVVGVGGLGCPAALYLAGAGVGQLTLVDGGRVELSNLHRQVLFTTDDLGAPKAAAAVTALRARNPFIQLEGLATELAASNARALVAGRTVVLDCTDNFATRFILHDACLAAGVPLVQAAVHRFEGTLDVFGRGAGGCLHCQWKDRIVAELDTAAGNCTGAPVFGPAVGVLGVMQAGEALKIILGCATDESFRQTHLVNLLDCSVLSIARQADPACPVCGPKDSFRSTVFSNQSADPILLSPEEVVALGKVQMIALLEPGEALDPARAASGTIAVPVGDVARIRELAALGPVILTCRHGVRSAALARLLRLEGMPGSYALAGGLAGPISLKR